MEALGLFVFHKGSKPGKAQDEGKGLEEAYPISTGSFQELCSFQCWPFLAIPLFPTGSWHCLNRGQMQASAPLLVGV